MAWYDAGTVTTTASSTTVTGSGTGWVLAARVGDAIYLGGQGIPYEIVNIASDTALSISRPYTGTAGSGQSYLMVPYQGYVKNSADRLAGVVAQYEGVLTDVDDLQMETALISQSDAQQGIATNVAGWSSHRVRQAIQSPLEAGSFSIPISSISQYDKGVFTPTVYGSTSAGSATYADRSGNYEIIGSTLSFWIRVQWSGHTGTGGVMISGVPLPSAVFASLSTWKIPSSAVGVSPQSAMVIGASTIFVEGYDGTGSATVFPLEESGTLIISGQIEV